MDIPHQAPSLVWGFKVSGCAQTWLSLYGHRLRLERFCLLNYDTRGGVPGVLQYFLGTVKFLATRYLGKAEFTT
eukprot:1136827-Rhodomonas_salina.2